MIAVHDLAIADRLLIVCEIAKTVGISKYQMSHILRKVLDMRKLSVRWMPCLLAPDNKQHNSVWPKPKEFLRRSVTVDEIRIH